MDKIRERFIERFNPIASTLAILLSYGYDEFWVAGSSLLKPTPNDFDIYSSSGFNFDEIKERAKKMGLDTSLSWQTRNALTMYINGTKVQFCNYKMPTIKDLIESFDFAHVQIGIAINIEWAPGNPDEGGGFDSIIYGPVVATEAWQTAMYEQESRYIGSKYPLSSLLRVQKYRQRDWLGKEHAKTCVLQTLTDIIGRGFKDYQDFKDQLRAVDLRLLELEQSEAAWNLWMVCCDRGLVEETSHIEQLEFMEGWNE